MKRDKLFVFLIVVVVGLTLLRLLVAGTVELLPEEAYYWTYSKHPALGYFDHPPMVAWMVHAGTLLLGDTERGVRIINMLLWIGSCALLWQTARIWFDVRVASGAALLFSALPIFVGIGFIVTPDGPLVFFWTLTLYAISLALHTGRNAAWLLAGVAFGGALLSKYYALLLAPSLLLFLLFSTRYRRWLSRPQPWLALGIALVVFSPVVIWNAQHQWASFAFQSSRASGVKGNALELAGMFWLVQLGILTPPLFVLMAMAAARAVQRGWRQREDRWNFVAAFSLPLFLLFAIASFKADVHLNWTAPSFLSLTLGGAAVWLEGTDDPDPRQARRWGVAAWLSGLLCAVVLVAAHVNVLFGRPESLAYSRVGGWRELAAQVDSAKVELSRRSGHKAFVLGVDKYNIAAELGFYLRNPGDSVNLYALGERGLGYRFWTDLERFEGRPAVVVVFNPSEGTLQELRAHFDRIDEPLPMRINAPARRWHSVYLVCCDGYHAKPRALTEASKGL
ncbi:MAG TPA: glycosyltransferase family 39 protein [Verrucomicrobiae bacterium]|nr:glycosyltransferase family 39 protein [Verrucomicrobiae bacterium]